MTRDIDVVSHLRSSIAIPTFGKLTVCYFSIPISGVTADRKRLMEVEEATAIAFAPVNGQTSQQIFWQVTISVKCLPAKETVTLCDHHLQSSFLLSAQQLRLILDNATLLKFMHYTAH